MSESKPLLNDEPEATNNRVSPEDVEEDYTRVKTSTRRKIAFGVLILAILLIVLAVVLGIVLAGPSNETDLQQAVQPRNIFSRLDQFNLIADRNLNKSRSVRTGYNASAEYVIEELTKAGVCSPVVQNFVVPVHQELEKATLVQLSPQAIVYQVGVDFQGMRYGGNGSFSITSNVFIAANAGCNVSDYNSIQPGQIAAAFEGQCDVVYKALAAEQALAGALLQLNLQTSTTLKTTRVRYVAWFEGDPLVQIPVISVSWSVGQAIVQQASVTDVQLSLTYNALLTLDYTYNIICDTNPSATSNIVMLGAHLDSVPEGPGLDDNASGSATVLEMAIQFHRLGLDTRAVNPVRYAWWGAEEIGLLGSRYYVRALQQAGQISSVVLYLNYDMLGAPNYTPQIHNGQQVNNDISQSIRDASTQIQKVYEKYFNNTAKPFEYASMTGGSDYLPFIEAGVPSGGMATGASALKTAEERAIFGGFANAAYDPCYHIACDTVFNVSQEGLRQCSEAASFVLQALAFQENIKAFLFPSN